MTAPRLEAGRERPQPIHTREFVVARVPTRRPVLSIMAEIADHDPRRAWDAFYARSAVLPDEPEPLAAACVAVLHDLAESGSVLELAVGHGRIAIPLATSGVTVDGID